MKKVLQILNSIHPFFIVFSVLCLNFLGWQLSGGEEQYLLYSKQYIDPDFIPNSFLLNEFPGTRLFFQLLTAPFLKYIDFEVFVFFARLINFLLFSFPLAKLFKHLGLTNLAIFVVIQLYIFGTQWFIGGEWIFRSFEPKTVAYIFVFWGLYFLFERKYFRVVILAAIAVHFHYLVGGWFFILAFLYFMVSGVNFKKLTLLGSTFAFLVLPFTIYLYFGLVKGAITEINGINLNWVYCYHRLPHHLGIFLSYEYFFENHFVGVALSFAGLLACVFYHRHIKSDLIKKINWLNIIMFSIVLFFVIIALIDKVYFDCQCRLFLKYYPFRLSALSRFLFYTEIVLILEKKFRNRKNLQFMKGLILVLITLLLLLRTVKNIKYQFKADEDPAFTEMIDYIKLNTEKDAVISVLYPDFGSSEYISFMRKAERENHCVVKFVPAETERIYEWYMRYAKHLRLRRDINKLVTYRPQDKMDYIVTNKQENNDLIMLIYQNSGYYLYKITQTEDIDENTN